jgi:uncharacterized membrane protein
MSPKGLPLTRHISSPPAIWVVSLASGVTVFGLAVFFQWLIYDDWLHDSGPLRLVGSLLAGALMFAIAFRWQVAIRQRRLEMLHRFETIRWMNDRIRNSLQAIECVTYASAPDATGQVRVAVDTIESVLQEVLAGTQVAAVVPSETRSESLTAR